MVQLGVPSDPVKGLCPGEDLHLNSRLFQQRGGLESALPGADHSGVLGMTFEIGGGSPDPGP